MKKKIFLMLTLLVGILSAKATNEVVVGDLTIPQGGSGVVNIELNNDDDEFTGYQFRLILPEGLNFVADKKGNPSFVAGDRYDDHSISSSTSGVFACISFSLAPISGTSGSLLSVDVTASADVAVGTKLNVTLGEIECTTSGTTPEAVKFEDVTFTVTIGEPTDTRVVLDETSINAPEAATGVDVRVKRTINANEWSTICLPFAMSTEQLNAAFGEMGTGWMLADFQGYETSEDDEENIVGISINFAKATALEANHPYLIKVKEAVSSFTVDGVEIDPEEEPTVAAVKRSKKQWSEFIGTYQAQTVVDNQMLFLNGNKFYYSNGNTKMKAFRGYFDFYDVLSEVENANSRVLLVWDGQATTIAEIDAPNVLKGSVYNLNGQFMGTDVDMKSLPKGIYTVDGKKVVNY